MRRHWAFFQARHPWWSGIVASAVILPFALLLVAGAGWIAAPFILFALVIVPVIEAVSWGPEGERRRRFIRKYGALPEWSEARWMREGSNWPYT